MAENKIEEIEIDLYALISNKAQEFLNKYGCRPLYVILPLHWTYWLSRYTMIINCERLYLFGMQICESPACETADDIVVY